MDRPTWDDFARLASAPVVVALQGQVRCVEPVTVERVAYAPPDFWRVEDETLRVQYLANDLGHYQWSIPDGRARFQPRRPGYGYSGGMVSPSLIQPRDLVNPVDDDFTRPLAPVEALTFLGRPAWRALLAPPASKPSPVFQVLDLASGITLSFQDLDGNGVLEFAALTTGVEFSSSFFEKPD